MGLDRQAKSPSDLLRLQDPQAIRGLISAALQWFEAHPGTASWLEAVGITSQRIQVVGHIAELPDQPMR
jgi:hypothetical protein